MATSFDSFGPFDAGAGASITEDTWRKFMAMIMHSGVLHGVDNTLQVYADSTGMQVKVKTGEAWIRGHWGRVNAEKTLSIAAAHATLQRLDRVVARVNFTSNSFELDVLTGTAGSGSAVAVTQNTSLWEISLAIVTVPATDTSIDAGQVADTRAYTGATRPKGTGAYRPRASTSSGSTSSTAVGVERVDSVFMDAGQVANIDYRCHPDSTNTADIVRTEVRYSSTGNATTSDTIAVGTQAYGPASSSNRTWRTKWTAPAAGVYSFALTFGRGTGSGTCTLFSDGAARITELDVTLEGNAITNGADL